MEFSRLEKAAIEVILSIPADGMDIVRAQYVAASVVKRDYSGVGFFTEISVPRSVPLMPDSQELRATLHAGAITRPKSDPEGWVFFMLWADDGYITCLEAYTVRDSWPGEAEMDDISPCETRPGNCPRPPMAERAVMPDCDDRLGTWRVNTSGITLLRSAVPALIALVAIGVFLLLLVGCFM